MDAKSIIENKRQKKELTEDEIRHFINKYNQGDIKSAQAAVIIELMHENGLTENELVALTKAIAETGEMINLSEISNDLIDIHSIGGLNDKASIILTCALASLGIQNVKVAGRELGLCDKLKTIPGYNDEIDIEGLKNNLKEVGAAIIAEPKKLAPVENKIYSIRNAINCTDDLQIISAGIMGMKIALGANNIIFEIYFGDSSYIKTKEDAKSLAKLLIRIGKYFNKSIKCVITDYNEPIGYNFGNIMEIEEIIKCLKGDIPADIKELVVEVGNKYMSFLNTSGTEAENKKKILEVIENGKAYNKFIELMKAQGADISVLENIQQYKKTKISIPVFASGDGYITKIDIDMVKSIAIFLNAIRVKDTAEIDIGAGIILNKKVGDKVAVGEILAYIHTNDETKLKGAVENLQDAFIIEKRQKNKNALSIEFIE